MSLTHLLPLFCNQIHSHPLLNKRSKEREALINQFSSPLCLSNSPSLSKVACGFLLGSVCEQYLPWHTMFITKPLARCRLMENNEKGRINMHCYSVEISIMVFHFRHTHTITTCILNTSAETIIWLINLARIINNSVDNWCIALVTCHVMCKLFAGSSISDVRIFVVLGRQKLGQLSDTHSFIID